MSNQNEPNREELALDALIAAAMLGADCEDIQYADIKQCESVITPDDKAALAQLPKNLLDQVISGAASEEKMTTHEKSSGRRLQTAMNRGDDTGELTDAARAEMERKRKESEKPDDENAEGSSK